MINNVLCKQCKFFFPSNNLLDRHLRSKTCNANVFRTKICQSSINTLFVVISEIDIDYFIIKLNVDLNKDIDIEYKFKE